MIVTIVHVKVKPEFVGEFIKITSWNHEQSIKEPGNLRFDVLQKPDDPTVFVLYEAYADENSSLAHKKTPHYLEWREKVADWMAKPREGVRYNTVKPE